MSPEHIMRQVALIRLLVRTLSRQLLAGFDFVECCILDTDGDVESGVEGDSSVRLSRGGGSRNARRCFLGNEPLRSTSSSAVQGLVAVDGPCRPYSVVHRLLDPLSYL
jgi:hypothetical protein